MSVNKYVQLVKAPTEYAKRMNHLSKRIFGKFFCSEFENCDYMNLLTYFLGEVSIPCDSKSMKVVSLFSDLPLQKKNFFVNWYPRHVETGKLIMRLREYGLFRDEHQDFKEEMKRLRALRGKVPPKRGEGKRAKISKSG